MYLVCIELIGTVAVCAALQGAAMQWFGSTLHCGIQSVLLMLSLSFCSMYWLLLLRRCSKRSKVHTV